MIQLCYPPPDMVVGARETLPSLRFLMSKHWNQLLNFAVIFSCAGSHLVIQGMVSGAQPPITNFGMKMEVINWDSTSFNCAAIIFDPKRLLSEIWAYSSRMYACGQQPKFVSLAPHCEFQGGNSLR